MMRCRTRTPFLSHVLFEEEKKKVIQKSNRAEDSVLFKIRSSSLLFEVEGGRGPFFSLTPLFHASSVSHGCVWCFLRYDVRTFFHFFFLLFIFRGSTASSCLDREAENRTSIEARRRTPPKISPSFDLITFRVPHVHT